MESFFHTAMLLNANWVLMLLALLLQYHKLNDRKITTIPDAEILSYEGCKNCLFATKRLANRVVFIAC
jgi:hypothetical protein